MAFLQHIKPMLLDERPFDLHAPGWAYEIKFDGYRLMAEFGQGKCVLKTRNGANATGWFPEITRPLSNIKLFPEGPYVVDGEVCVIDTQGRNDFDRLHARAKRRSWYGGSDPVTFCVFDLLLANGADQAAIPYLERKERLQRLFKPSPAGVMTWATSNRTVTCSSRRRCFRWSWRAWSRRRPIASTNPASGLPTG